MTALILPARFSESVGSVPSGVFRQVPPLGTDNEFDWTLYSTSAPVTAFLIFRWQDRDDGWFARADFGLRHEDVEGHLDGFYINNNYRVVGPERLSYHWLSRSNRGRNPTIVHEDDDLGPLLDEFHEFASTLPQLAEKNRDVRTFVGEVPSVGANIEVIATCYCLLDEVETSQQLIKTVLAKTGSVARRAQLAALSSWVTDLDAKLHK